MLFSNPSVEAPHMFKGLRTAGYRVSDLDAAKAWYTDILGFGPYFDEPFYVGFEVGGYELGLQPAKGDSRPGLGGVVAYWGVEDAEAGFNHLIAKGATVHSPIQEVGGGIKVGTVLDPFGNPFGVIENPHFKLPDAE